MNSLLTALTGLLKGDASVRLPDDVTRTLGVSAGETLWLLDQAGPPVTADVEESAHQAVLELDVVEDNTPAVRLYRRLGFVETGTHPGARSGEVLRRMRYLAPT